MKTILIAFCSLVALSTSLAHAVEVTEDARYVYTKYTWSEISDDRQRELILNFNHQLLVKLQSMGLPTQWSQSAECRVLGERGTFQRIVEETQIRADQFADQKNVRLADLIPTGFMVGVGINGSGNYFVGIGGSALLTMTVVPMRVVRVDKITAQERRYYEVAWALGGIGQGGFGAGGGGGAVFRGILGLVWGPLPNPSAMTGWALGVSGDIGAAGGLGFKAAVVSNSTTRHHNLVAMATFDVGANAGGELHGTLFYFMTASQVMKYIVPKANAKTIGTTTVDEDRLGSLCSS